MKALNLFLIICSVIILVGVEILLVFLSFEVWGLIALSWTSFMVGTKFGVSFGNFLLHGLYTFMGLFLFFVLIVFMIVVFQAMRDYIRKRKREIKKAVTAKEYIEE
jgi:uncharacterized membrane protein